MTMHSSNSPQLQIRRAGVKVRCMQSMIALILLLLVLFGNSAWAACTLSSPSTPIKAQALLSGNITVGPDVPVGTVLYHARYWSDQSVTLSCTAGTDYASKLYQTTPYPALTNIKTPQQGQSVYATPISGIGVYVWSHSQELSAPGYATFNFTGNTNEVLTSAGAGNIGSYVSFDVYLIRTPDPLGGGGVISGSNLPTVHFNFGPNASGVGNTDYLIGSFTGSINVVTNTCTTPSNLTVQMGTHLTTELKGQGTATNAWVPVNIPLTNCPAFYGYIGETTDARSTNTGSPNSGFNIGPNTIAYSVTPSYGVANASNGVMNLAPGGATGIGIQLVGASGSALQFNTSTNSNLGLTQTAGQSYNIALDARYYQTGTSITAGAANSTATVTLTYN
jgi:type 1 fimbria pilin